MQNMAQTTSKTLETLGWTERSYYFCYYSIFMCFSTILVNNDDHVKEQQQCSICQKSSGEGVERANFQALTF